LIYSIVWEPPAIDVATRFLTEDPQGLRILFAAIDHLATDPRPETSLPFGSQDLRRIRIGRYRALYQVSDSDHSVVVTHLGRSG
jgi:mRNA interferase RelE/StbE